MKIIAKKYKIFGISPLLLAGILLIMLPIFAGMTIERIRGLDDFIIQRGVERGMALIRTFESGTRAGMMNMRWEGKRIQLMLEETATQPGIEYITIVTPDGSILAHSDPSRVGGVIKNIPNALIQKDEALFAEHSKAYHRILEQPSGMKIFELYKRFVPILPSRHKDRFKRFRERHRSDSEDSSFHRGRGDWTGQHFRYFEKGGEQGPAQFIFVGFSMKKGLELRKRMVRETIGRTIVFFLLGCAGFAALFAYQAYRSTKASLSSIQAFSDNVVQNMPSGLVTLGNDFHITMMNQAAGEIFGQDLEEPYPEWIEMIQQISLASPVVHNMVSLKAQNGQTVALEGIASAVKDGQGKEMGFLLLFRDLSQIRALQKEVETNKRLAAIGKLAAGVAHEIRNPLSSIKGFAAYFSNRYKDNESDYQTARIMEGEVERINRSITQLLEFAKPLSVDKKTTDLNLLIEHSLRLVQPDLDKKSIKSSLTYSSVVKTIPTDPDRMNQVFLNLYINAIEALDDNGSLEIIVSDSSDDRIEIRVKDNGCGMDQASLERIFDPYYTTRPTGTGLGLSIVHSIIEKLDGQIRVESTKGQGTCFIILLPISEEP